MCSSFSVDMYLSLGIFLSSPIFSVLFVSISELFCGKVLETFLILSTTLLPFKLPVAFIVFWIDLFETVLCASTILGCMQSSRFF